MDPLPFIRMLLEREIPILQIIHKFIQNLLDTGSELMHILRDPNAIMFHYTKLSFVLFQQWSQSLQWKPNILSRQNSLKLETELLLQNQRKDCVSSVLEIVNQNIIPGGITEIIATIKDLRYARIVISSTAPIDYYVQSVQKPIGSWRMTVEYQKLNQVLMSICSCASRLGVFTGTAQRSFQFLLCSK